MDPHLPESYNHRTEKLATGRIYHFVDQLPDNYDLNQNTTLLCVHGFPDLWYGFRYQIGPWVRRGYRVVVPDMLGYGGTEKPVEVSDYSIKKICADLAALLDLLEIKSAVFIGHDWGSFIVSRFALWHPNRISALAMLSVPYIPPSRDYIPLEEAAKRTPILSYQVYFAASKSNLEILANIKKFLLLIYTSNLMRTLSTSIEDALLRGPDPSSSDIMNDQEFDYYHAEFRKGMVGPLNYYRTQRIRYDEELGLPDDLPSDLPFLLLWGTKDFKWDTKDANVVSPSITESGKHKDIALEGRGHWLMVEAKDEVTESIVKWLEGLNI